VILTPVNLLLKNHAMTNASSSSLPLLLDTIANQRYIYEHTSSIIFLYIYGLWNVAKIDQEKVG
jgi:hypothetical protein